MIRRPPRSTRTYTLFPYTTLFRSSVREYCAYIARNLDMLRVEDGNVMASVLDGIGDPLATRSEEHTSELQPLMRISYAVFCLKIKTCLFTQPTPALV